MRLKLAKPRILFTMGDPNGIGPEIILKIFNLNSITSRYDLKVVGSAKVFKYYSELLKLPDITPEKLIEIKTGKSIKVKPGFVSEQAGKLSGDSIRKGIKLCLKKASDALVTLPISNEAFNQ